MRKAILSALCLALLLFAVPAFSSGQEPAGLTVGKIDKEYIKKNFPEVYEEIFNEGKEAGIRESGAAVPAEGKTTEAAAVLEGQTETKADLGDWWNKSSLEYDPIPPQFLFRREIQYGFQRTTGNMDSFAHALTSRIDIRKKRFTNSTAYTVDKNDIETVFAGESEKDHQIVEDTLKYDITKKVFANAGFIWERNNLALIDSRYAIYGGFGYRFFTLDRHKLYALLAYGYLDETYTGDAVKLLGFDKRNFNTIFLDQSYQWNITDRISFNEKFRTIHSLNSDEHFDLDESGNVVSRGQKRRNIIIFSLGLDFKITDSFSFTNAYLINYDRTPWPGVKTEDTQFMSGVKLSF